MKNYCLILVLLLLLTGCSASGDTDDRKFTELPYHISDGINVYKFTDNNIQCYVTTSNSYGNTAISCVVIK